MISRYSFILSVLFIASLKTALHGESRYITSAYVAPEIYYVKRQREGGAKQDGGLYGVRLGFDRIKRNKIYWGGDILWATGTLNGHREEIKLKSQLTNTNGEMRIGYTFFYKWMPINSFTAYLGLGSYYEDNIYKHPSPTQVHLKNRFSYIPIGFLSEIFAWSNMSIGLNFKMRYLWEGKQYVSNEPKHKHAELCYERKLQYRVELPFKYFCVWKNHELVANFQPFFEYQHYGYSINYPYDFLDTKYQFYGATLQLIYLF